MKIKHDIFSLPKPIFWFLILANIAYAFWLDHQFGSFWAWNIADLAHKHDLKLEDFVAVGQFILFAVSVDMAIRHFVIRFNETTEKNPLPVILVQAMTISSYGLIGLIGFIVMYDHSAGQILAASGAIGFGVVYVLREFIADIVACIQIQSDGLIRIGDCIEVEGGEYYEVVQIDHRMVVLRNAVKHLVRIPNRRFIEIKYINLNQQDAKMGARRIIEIDLDSGNDADKIIELLTQAAEYFVKSDSRYPWYCVRLAKINCGIYTFTWEYECDPSLTPKDSKNRVSLVAARFLRLGGINMNYTVEVTRSSDLVHTINGRLKDVYRFGVLKALSVEQVTHLSDVAQIVTCRANHLLIEKGHNADSMYILMEGGLEVTIPNDQGEQVVVATIWPGECVGEMSLLTGEPRSANVRAKVSSTLLEITKADITPIFEDTPELIDEISTLLEGRKAANQAYFNQALEPEEVKKNIQILAKKILKFFFHKG
jgi:small-conductance mechanosensitive channel